MVPATMSPSVAHRAETPHRVLVRATNWLGDALLAYPAVAFLRRCYPAARLTLLARPGAAQLYRHNPHLDELLVAPQSAGWRGGLDPVREASLVRQGRYDAAFILPNSFAAALPIALAGVARRVGYATDGRRWLLTEPKPLSPHLRGVHQVYYYLALVGYRAEDGPPAPPRVHLTADECTAAEALLADAGVEAGADFLACAPGAAYGTAKRWPADRYGAVGRLAAQRWGWRVVLLGSASERAATDEAAEIIGSPAVNLAGATPIRLAAAILARARLVLTNDSGLMHVAAAVGARVTAVFGPTDIVTTSPVGDGHRVVRQPVDCSPCLLRHCPIDHRCMIGVAIEAVWRALEEQRAAG